MKKKSLTKTVSRFFRWLKWRYDFVTCGPIRIDVDLGRRS